MIVSKSEARSKSELDNKSKEKKVSQLKEFVAKFGAGTRASQVQSRIKEIERLQPQDLKKSNIQRPYIRFNNPEKPSGQIVFKLEHIAKSFNGVSVIPDFSLEIHKGDKIGVIGNNGRGKTTLLRMIAGVLSPDKGQVVLGHQVDLGYFPQNHTDILEKASKESMIDWLRTKKTHVIEQDIRGVLGKLLFSGDEGLKFLYQLSGGETARVILASLMLNNFNTLILDEPNNHLDLESVSALGVGLKEFKGTVVVASHDRDLLTHCATKIISLEEDGIHFHNGPLEEFLKEKEASQRR